MVINPLGQEGTQVMAEEMQSHIKTKEEKIARKEEPSLSTAQSDRVEISPEAREKANGMKGEGKQEEGRGQDNVSQSTTLTMGKSKNDEKEDAVDELEDTNSDIKKKEDEIQEAKVAFVGTEEEKAQKLKKLKQDLGDLEDTKKELQSTLAS